MDENVSYIVIAVLLVVVLGLLFKVMNQKKALAGEGDTKSTTIEEKRNAALESMTENIYDMTKNLIESKGVESKALESAILNSADNLRELLKIKANKVEIFYETFGFSQMLDEITANMVPNFKDQKTELVFNVDQNIPTSLTTDLVHLSRIINNILEFSMLASPEGTVTLKAWSQGRNSDILNIEIQDSSQGMNSQELQSIFNLSHNDQTGEHVGLALYIAKELSSHMGGRLEAKSKVGEGNRFLVSVPVEVISENNVSAKKGISQPVTDKKVLIYAQNRATAHALKELLGAYYKYITIIERSEMDKMKVNFVQYDILLFEESFFTHKKADHLSLIKRSKALQIVSFRSIFTNDDVANYSCIDMHITMPMTCAKGHELVAYLEDYKTEVSSPQSSYVGNLPVYKEDIVETEGIDQHDFKDFAGAKLLIVEDNLINQKILLGILKNAEMEIDIANNGQEALDLLFEKKKSYDIVLMDISMPVMDGETATRKIRESSQYNEMPIVTFTAFAMGKEIEQMFMVGVNAYLTKPLNIRKLYTVFKSFLSEMERKVVEKEVAKVYNGLDIEKGISWADQNETLYKETLKEFISAYSMTATEMATLVEAEDYDSIKLKCREIQGILTYIGAYEMKALIDEIQEKLMDDNKGLAGTCKEKYPAVLKKLISNIKLYIGD